MSDGQIKENPAGELEVNEEIKDPKAVLDKNRELLGKMKALAAENKEIKEKLSMSHVEKLAAEGKKDELIEAYKRENQAVKEQHTKMGWNVISSQIAVEAAKKGCVNTSTLMKVIDFENASINTTDFSIAREEIELILEKATKEHEYLFKKNVSAPKDGGIGSGPQKMEISKLSMDDLKDIYRKL